MRGNVRGTLLVVAACLLAGGCNPTVDNDSASVTLVVTGFEDATGERSGQFVDVVSDRGVAQDYTVFVNVRAIPKNAAAVGSDWTAVRIQGYQVFFTRDDMVNTPGVTVPFPFSMAISGFVEPGGEAKFEIVAVTREMAVEDPLRQLWFGTARIYATMHLRVYGQDLVGNTVSADAIFPVIFGDF